MKRTMNAGGWMLAGVLVATSALAEKYDYEAGFSFDRSQFSGSQTITTPGGTIFNSGDTDTDNLSVFGSWYFAGLSDDKGPRAQAAFVDRASAVSAAYSRLDQTRSVFLSSTDPNFLFPPIDSRFDAKGDSFTVDVRYVDRDSGWFGSAGLLSSDATLSGFVDDSVDATGWSLGGGKYLFDMTTLGIEFSQVDLDGGLDATVVAVSFAHLGSLGERWQYAVDLGYSRADTNSGPELDTWDASIALYPNRDFEFGIGVQDVSADSPFIGLDTTGIEGFASWYVTPKVRLSARYRVDDADYFGNVNIGGATSVSDADQDSIGFSATVRF